MDTQVVKLDAIARSMTDAQFLAWLQGWLPPNTYARIEARFDGATLDWRGNYVRPDDEELQTEDCPE